MDLTTAHTVSNSAARLVRSIRRPHMLLLMPVLIGLGYLWGGQSAMVFVALAFPVALAVALPADGLSGDVGRDFLTGLVLRQGVVGALNVALTMSRRLGWSTGAFVIEIDRFKLIEERFDHAAVSRIVQITSERICDNLRDADVAGRLDGPSFAVALSPVRRLDLDVAIQLAGRIQRAVAEPIHVDGTSVYVSVSIGFSLAARLENPDGEAVLQSAFAALIEAQRNGPSAVRSYSGAMKERVRDRNNLAEQVRTALEAGEIRPFFQPQISTGTGAITGFEALARWHHPERGLIPPVEFLPALAQTGLMGRLGFLMLRGALDALTYWDQAGYDVPRVSVNFSSDELCDPGLVDRIAEELERSNLTPDRLVVEVLETVVASRTDDMVIRNLAGLARLGCCLDLDDFGTGHASITSIRRFSIERIKIDRSFITQIDQDLEQQKMVSAILTMADRLGLDTLAEGVETVEEQEMLMRLGCGHVQGFALARPMPLAETNAWIENHGRQRQSAQIRHLKVI